METDTPNEKKTQNTKVVAPNEKKTQNTKVVVQNVQTITIPPKRESSDTFMLETTPTLRKKAKKIARFVVSLILMYRFCRCKKKQSV